MFKYLVVYEVTKFRHPMMANYVYTPDKGGKISDPDGLSLLRMRLVNIEQCNDIVIHNIINLDVIDGQ